MSKAWFEMIGDMDWVTDHWKTSLDIIQKYIDEPALEDLQLVYIAENIVNELENCGNYIP